MAKTLARSIDLEPIDRLEEKVKLLVGMIERLRGEQAQLADENTRLTRTIESLETRLADAESTDAELSSLREEREVIRGRVSDMLEQLEALSL
jgi:regulator of replication initiation timing